MLTSFLFLRKSTLSPVLTTTSYPKYLEMTSADNITPQTSSGNSFLQASYRPARFPPRHPFSPLLPLYHTYIPRRCCYCCLTRIFPLHRSALAMGRSEPAYILKTQQPPHKRRMLQWIESEPHTCRKTILAEKHLLGPIWFLQKV